MLKWIVANKDLLFSGLGVAVGGWILRTIFSRPAEPKNTMSSRVNADHITGPIAIGNQVNQVNNYNHRPDVEEGALGPSLKEIAKELAQAIPYQRRNVQESYVGQEIRWKLEFFNLTEWESEPNLAVSALCLDGSLSKCPFVTFRTDATRYPFLKQIRPKSLIQITGHILCVDSLKVEVEVSGLELLTSTDT